MSGMGRGDFRDAVETIRQSGPWAFYEEAARVWRVSASHSRVVAAAARGRRALDAMPRRERLRSIAVTVAVAAAGHALLVGLVPPPLRPAVPRVFWMAVSVAAAGAAIRGWRGKD
jgi:hypothetical protein